MGKMQRNKGKTGEREVAAILRDAGFADARRGAQYHGGPDSPDVDGLPGWHIEVKRCEALRLWAAMDQARADAGDARPVVVHRPNGRQWIAIIDLSDFLELVKDSMIDKE